MAAHCSFCGSSNGPFSKVEGLFTVLMCADCQAARGHGSGPYPVMTRAQMRAGLDLLPTWALEQKATAFSALACERTDLVGGCEAVEEGAGLRALRTATLVFEVAPRVGLDYIRVVSGPRQEGVMAEDPPQPPVERRDESVVLGGGRRGLDSMMVAPPVPASQLPDPALPQATVGGDGASPQGSDQGAAPVDYDG